MRTTANMKIKLFKVRTKKTTIAPDDTCNLEIEVDMANKKQNNNEFVENKCIFVESSKLSLNDDFMKHKPKTEEEKEFKETLIKVIKTGVDDFYRPRMDPAFFDRTMKKVKYMPGKRPAIGKSYIWWEKTIKNSELSFGTKSQYVAFLAVLIKKLVAEGWTVDEAWNAICNDSRKLGHYRDSYNAKQRFEDTGSREICGFFDLGNTCKILAKDEETGGFWKAGGNCYTSGKYSSLSNFVRCIGYANNRMRAVAWLVLK